MLSVVVFVHTPTRSGFTSPKFLGCSMFSVFSFRPTRSHYALGLLGALLLVVAACSRAKQADTDTLNARASSEDAAANITLLYVADIHAQLNEHPELFWEGDEDRLEMAGGFARIVQALRDTREALGDDHTITIDGGDTIQGSALAAITDGKLIVPLLDMFGFDVAIPGNWEVAYGPDVMKARLNETQYPWIATNIFDKATGEQVFSPTWMTERQGVKIGFVGFTDPDVPFRQPPSYSEGLRYDDHSTLNDYAQELRDDGADVVILVSHIGLSKALKLTESLEGYDIHLSADTHERTYEPFDVNGVWVVEPGSFGSFMGKLRLRVADGKIVDKSWELVELTADAFGEAEDVQALLEELSEPYKEHLSTPLGILTEGVGRYDVVETTLDNLLADALRDATGTEIALSNGFRFGTPIEAGELTEANLYDFYPVVTNLKTGEVTGQQLLEFWERELENVFAKDASKRFGGWVPRPSGMHMKFRAHGDKGSRVEAVTIGGEPLDPERVYTITACEREGDEEHMVCRIPHVSNPKVHELDAHEAVRQYLRKHPEITAPARDRILAIDLPDVVRSQTMLPDPTID